MNAEDIRHWLMQSPRPAIVRVITEDDQENDLACGPQAGIGWKKLAATIFALEWKRCEARDAEMKLIRATNNVDLDNEEPEEERKAQRAPLPPPPANADAETQRMYFFATMLAEAYRHSTDVAFERLTDLIQSMNDRAVEGDRARETYFRSQIRTLEAQIRALGKEPVEAGGDLLTTILGTFASGMASGQHQHSNGADKDAE